MFEKFVLGKIESENNIVNDFWGSVLSGEKHLKEAVVNSRLSDFTKNYIVNDLTDTDGKDELLTKIEKSNKLYFNYAIRPKWTLMTFLFGNFESRPPGEIIRKLNTFPFYNFYADSINDFIRENSQIFVTKAEITVIIDSTNKAVYEKLMDDTNNAKIKNFFLQIFRLKHSEENYNLESTIPYSFIKIFLQDKEYTDLEKKFGVIKEISNEYEISLKDIIKILTGKYGVTEKHEEVKKKEVVQKEVLSLEKPLETVEKKTEPVNVLLVEEKTVKEKSTVKEIQKEKQEKTSEASGMYSEQLIRAEKEKKSEVKKENEKVSGYDLKDLFNKNQLEKISAKVYKSDLIYREKSFNKLNNFKTWFEASNHLKEVFRINNVDMYNKDVVSFIDILNDYYQNRE